MRILAVLVLCLGIALAGGGLHYSSKYFEQRKASSVTTEYVQVAVAGEVLAPGVLLQPDHLKWIAWPRGSVPAGAFTSPDALLGDAGLRQRYVMRSLEPGELILDGKVSKPGESGRFVYTLPPGMRAVSIPINAVTGVSGFITSGDRVDILLIRKVQGQLVASMLLQDIEVLAIDQTVNTGGGSPRVGRTATVAATNEQSQRLALARQAGRLSLLLRSPDAPVGDLTAPVGTDALDDLLRPPEEVQKTIKVNRPSGSELVPVQ